MALVQRNCINLRKLIGRIQVRSLSSPTAEKDIKKSVFISQSKDIYTNLALEDWLYRNFDFTNHHVLMLWQNDPCVVIGRHQNPWLESNMSQLSKITENGVKLARRNSGGGTVYHDLGNLNLTFFTPRERYNRKYNLELITRSLFREFNTNIQMSPREDLVIRDFKQVSGTAAKLGRPNAYHHCTLLVNANKVDLSQALQKEDVIIKTNATQSVKSKIMNICEENPKITVSKLMQAVGWEYMRTPAMTLIDGGKELANQQKGFQMINPTEQWFPGINEIRDEFTSWDWCFAKTPKFEITKSFVLPHTLHDIPTALKVTMTVDQGRIDDVKLFIPPGLSSTGFTGEASVITNLKGQKFTQDALNSWELLLGSLVNDKDKFVTECLKQVMTSV